MADYYGRDWGDTDFPLLTSADTLYGVHTGVRKFFLPSGVTVKVKKYDGTNNGSGGFHLRCRFAKIAGTLDATGAGYGSGGGGGGGGGINDEPSRNGPGGAGGIGDAASGATNGTYGGSSGYSTPGGTGGRGGGPASAYASAGGYNAVGVNTDPTTDDSVLMGSGGAGAPGGHGGAHNNSEQKPAGGGGGGGAGRRGGGLISISACQLEVTGEILTRDLGAQNGGNGGNASYAWYTGGIGGAGGAGGSASVFQSSSGGAGGSGVNGGNPGGSAAPGYAGAGGGVCMKHNRSLSQVSAKKRVVVTGQVNAYGGLNDVNGGTVKIFAPTYFLDGVFYAGRKYSPDESGANRSRVPPFGAVAG